MVCHYVICVVLGAAFTACNENGIIDRGKFHELAEQLTQPGKVIIAECVGAGERPSLTYTDKAGALIRRKDQKCSLRYSW